LGISCLPSETKADDDGNIDCSQTGIKVQRKLSAATARLVHADAFDRTSLNPAYASNREPSASVARCATRLHTLEYQFPAARDQADADGQIGCRQVRQRPNPIERHNPFAHGRVSPCPCTPGRASAPEPRRTSAQVPLTSVFYASTKLAIFPLTTKLQTYSTKSFNRRYERKPVILTTNRPFKEWNEVFPNATCIATLLDRLLHHADVTVIEGKSYRVRESEQEAAARRRKK
jgi:IstB-like ATP binding protein